MIKNDLVYTYINIDINVSSMQANGIEKTWMLSINFTQLQKIRI